MKQAAGSSAGLEALFDSGYSTGLNLFNSFASASSIDSPLPDQQKQRDVQTDSGLCIDSVDTGLHNISDDGVDVSNKTKNLFRVDPRSLLPDDDGDT